jgi:hypothetical protein
MYYAISRGLHIPSSLQIVQKQFSWKGFVGMLAYLCTQQIQVHYSLFLHMIFIRVVFNLIVYS